MYIYDSSYWKLTVTLQKFIGLWYFQSTWRNCISWFYVYGFTFSFMISMGIKLFNEIGVNISIVVENIVGEMYLTVVFSKLTASIVFKKKLKYIYEQIERDWKMIKDKEELKIMHRYTDAGRKSVTLYSAYMIVGVGFFLILPITTPLLDYINPLENATRPKALPYFAEYGIDQEAYYYPLMVQAIFGGFGTITVLVTFDLGFIMIVQHVVALFALINYRLAKVSQVADAIEKHRVDNVKGNLYAYGNMVSAIHLHQTVIRYVDLVENCYNLAWFVILFLNMNMIGGGLSVILMKLDRPEECVRYCVVIGACFIHFYYIFLPGQKIINSSLEVFDACYACKWYNLSEKSKCLIKIMMTRSLRHCELTGGKMFVMCMDTYCNMSKTGFSIFTVLR